MILVTGATGFLGKRVVARLAGLPMTETSLSMYGSMGVDLRDDAAAYKLFKTVRPTVVINCAAFSGGLEFARTKPAEIFRYNMLITLNLLDLCAGFNVTRVINPIANCAYPARASVFREIEFWDGPLHPSVLAYGFSRKASWVGANAYREQHGLDTVSLVLSNLYGPGDHLDPMRSHALGALVRKMILAKKNGEPEVVVWGSGTPVREWLYVDDAAEAMVRAIDLPPTEQIVNIGTETGFSIRNLAENIRREVGYTGELRFDASKPDGATCKTVNGELGKKLLGWAPEVGLIEGLRRTITWATKELA
jgi:GDP-L-fucose synthase